MKQIHKEILLLLTGCILYVLSTVLINPVNIVPGSVLGVAVTAHALSGISIGTVNLICNVPIMAVCTLCFGKKILIYTIAIIFSTSVLIDWWLPYFPPFLAGHEYLLAVIGGGLMGLGAGLLMRAGGTMGGTTALGMLLQKKFPSMNMGVALFVMDTTIIVGGSLLLRSFTGLICSIIYTLVCSKVIDMTYA